MSQNILFFSQHCNHSKKLIAKITSSRNRYTIELNGNKFDANDIESIVALKKQIIEITNSILINALYGT